MLHISHTRAHNFYKSKKDDKRIREDEAHCCGESPNQ